MEVTLLIRHLFEAYIGQPEIKLTPDLKFRVVLATTLTVIVVIVVTFQLYYLSSHSR